MSTIYRIKIIDRSNNDKELYYSSYHTTELGPYREAERAGFVTENQPFDKDWQIIPETKTLITD